MFRKRKQYAGPDVQSVEQAIDCQEEHAKTTNLEIICYHEVW